MVKEVKNMDSIDWKNHVINSNDFKYSQIAEQLQGMQKAVIALTMITSGLGLVVLMLILTLRMRGRIQEAGILLAIGKSKQEIMGQFLFRSTGFTVAWILAFRHHFSSPCRYIKFISV